MNLDTETLAAILAIIGAITTMAVTIIRELRGLQQSVAAQTAQMQASDQQKIQLARRLADSQPQSAAPVNLISQSSTPDIGDVLARVERRLADERPSAATVAAALTSSASAPAVVVPDWATRRAARAEANL